MINYLDKVLYLYPDIQRVSFWETQYDCTPWNDPYDGLVWENTDIEKPSKETLDALDDAVVSAELDLRKETARKAARDAFYQDDIYMKLKFNDYLQVHANATFSQFLDSVEAMQ